MKRNILLVAVLMLLAVNVQAQVIIKHVDKERIEFGSDKLVKMVFNSYGENNGDNIHFIRQSGDTLTFDIDDIYTMGFAEDFTRIDEVKEIGDAAIVYDAAEHVVYIVNVEEKGVVRVFNAEGKPVKSTEGTMISVADLTDGLYIVTYNMELNAKIVKK